MKIHLILAFAASSFAFCAKATLIDLKLYKLSGEAPSAAEAARLSKEKILSPVYERSVKLNKQGNFSISDQQDISFPAKFSIDGKPSGYKEKKVGVFLSGVSKTLPEFCDAEFEFSFSKKEGDWIYLHQNGNASADTSRRQIQRGTSLFSRSVGCF